MGRTWKRIGLLTCALFAAASPAVAQVALFPRQGLSFGVLTAGIADRVDPTDAARRAELEIVGEGDYTVVVQVPAALQSPEGRTLPLRFEAGDGLIRWRKSNKETPFQPGQTVSIRIPKGLGGAYVWVGGTAQPAAGQPPGGYSASITVQIIPAGT